MLDALIVGGGPSGLAASYFLQPLNVLTLERSAMPGGRVQSRHQAGASYDMGAVFAYDPEWLPFDFESPPLIREAGPIGLLQGDHLVLGLSVTDCLAEASFDLQERSEIEAFSEGRIASSALSPNPYAALNAHFKVIYPSEMGIYCAERQQDALYRSVTDHYERGNGTLIEALTERILTPVVTGADVKQIETRDDEVLITYVHEGQARETTARTVIVATPANAAKQIIRPISSTCSSFLNNVRYGRFTVVALGLEFDRHTAVSFSYVVTPELPCDTIVCQRSANARQVVMLVYYGESLSAELHRQEDEAIAKLALTNVRLLPDEGIRSATAVFSDVQRWDPGGAILTPDHTAADDPARLNATARVFLAGDYTHQPFPFGMNAALRSSRAAAAMATHALFRIVDPRR